MLAGRPLEFADFDRSRDVPRSIADGLELSSDGRDDAGDLGTPRFDKCDLDRDSIDGRAGNANSGFNFGLGSGLSKDRGELKVRV
jgi:hypothetical protein